MRQPEAAVHSNRLGLVQPKAKIPVPGGRIMDAKLRADLEEIDRLKKLQPLTAHELMQLRMHAIAEAALRDSAAPTHSHPDRR
jgi:hypothetical protein